MTITYQAAVKTARMTATRDQVANGTLEITTSADVVLATHGLDAAGGTISGAVWTLVLDATTVTASATGTAAKARVKDSGGTVRVSNMTVGTSGTEVVLDSTSITSGQNVTISSSTITHAPDP